MNARENRSARVAAMGSVAALLLLATALVAETPWSCVPVPVEPACPADAPVGLAACTGDLRCEYGEECCCGACHPSLVCECGDGVWGCFHTDACLAPPCEEACPAEPPIDEDGCRGDLRCEYGEECCCGACHPSLVCQCGGGGWGCYYTDACLVPFCPGECRDHRDCEGGAMCLAPDEPLPCGACYVPEHTCTDDADCGDLDLVCEFVADGCICSPTTVCVPPCASAADCEEGETCTAGGHCVASPCTANADCPAHFVCTGSGMTADASCARRACSTDGECSGGYCVRGRCYDTLGSCLFPPP